jgi:hypothetical protein
MPLRTHSLSLLPPLTGISAIRVPHSSDIIAAFGAAHETGCVDITWRSNEAGEWNEVTINERDQYIDNQKEQTISSTKNMKENVQANGQIICQDNTDSSTKDNWYIPPYKHKLKPPTRYDASVAIRKAKRKAKQPKLIEINQDEGDETQEQNWEMIIWGGAFEKGVRNDLWGYDIGN